MSCITFPQISQKVLTEDISYWFGTDHWNSKFSTNIQCEKDNHFCNILENQSENQQQITIFLTHFGTLRANFR